MFESLKKTDDGWYCKLCDQPLESCRHYHGEWQCLDCHEWTYPTYYEIEDGCSFCGSDNVKLEEYNVGEIM